jgi:predicted Holliday junction resolvase-like endonuclease
MYENNKPGLQMSTAFLLVSVLLILAFYIYGSNNMFSQKAAALNKKIRTLKIEKTQLKNKGAASKDEVYKKESVSESIKEINESLHKCEVENKVMADTIQELQIKTDHPANNMESIKK